MKIICYRKPLCTDRDAALLDRAAQRKHLLKKMILWDILLFAVVGILGPLLHFANDIFPAVPILQVIAPVNESIWEHLKLLFFPTVLVATLRRLCMGKLQHGLLTTFAEGLALSMFLQVVAFYSYSGILGTHDLRIDIALFYLSDLVLTIYTHKRASGQKKSSLPGLVILLLIAGCFFCFTFNPPMIGLFADFNQPVQ